MKTNNPTPDRGTKTKTSTDLSSLVCGRRDGAHQKPWYGTGSLEAVQSTGSGKNKAGFITVVAGRQEQQTSMESRKRPRIPASGRKRSSNKQQGIQTKHVTSQRTQRC